MTTVLKANTATITATYLVGETPTAAGAVTVTITNDRGTTLATGSATSAGVGVYSFTLTPTHTAAVDILTATWVSGTLGTITTTVEVVGGFYFGLDKLRAMPDLDNPVRYPTERLIARRDWITGLIEREVRTSFVERYHHESRPVGTLQFADPYNPYLPKPVASNQPVGILWTTDQFPISVVDIAFDGVSLDSTTLATMHTAYGRGEIYSGTWSTALWALTRYARVVDIRYTAAYTTRVPSDVHEAALVAARHKLLNTEGESAIPSRATSITNEYGNITMATPGKNGSITGIPEVDEVIEAWKAKIVTVGIA